MSPCDVAGVVILRWFSVDAADPSPFELGSLSVAGYPFVFADPLMPFVFGRCAVSCKGDEDVFAGSAWLLSVPLTVVSTGLVILHRRGRGVFSSMLVCEPRRWTEGAVLLSRMLLGVVLFVLLKETKICFKLGRSLWGYAGFVWQSRGSDYGCATIGR